MTRPKKRISSNKFWFDEAAGHVTPLLTTVLEAPKWTPILLSGDGGWQRPWGSVPVAAEIREGQGVWRVCQVKLTDRLQPTRWLRPSPSACSA